MLPFFGAYLEIVRGSLAFVRAKGFRVLPLRGFVLMGLASEIGTQKGT